MSPEHATGSTLTLHQVADRLGVHYMTVYRYIRTGRLPATKVGGEWQVAEGDVVAMETSPTAQRRVRQRRWDDLLVQRLIAGDEQGAWHVLQDCLASGRDPDAVYLEVIGPALAAIGDGWADGTIDVAEEHVASAIASRLLGRLGPLFGRRGRRRGVLILGAPAGDLHSLPVTLLADPLRGRGFQVLDLGADVPATSWAAAVARVDGLLAVGICATSTDDLDAVRSTVQAIHAATDAPVFVGGAAITDPAQVQTLGVDHVTPSADAALALVEQLAAERRPGAPSSAQ